MYKRSAESGEGKQVLAETILELPSVSPDGKWVVVAVSDAEDAEHPYRIAAYPVEGGGPRVPLCRTICRVSWDASGTHLVLNMFDGIHGHSFFWRRRRAWDCRRWRTGEERGGCEGVGESGWGGGVCGVGDDGGGVFVYEGEGEEEFVSGGGGVRGEWRVGSGEWWEEEGFLASRTSLE